MLDFWNAQSDTVKGAVLGAVVAMIGVIINGLVSGWNTSRQLKHDREQKARERALALRRDIYLGVAQHLQDTFNAINSVSDLNRSDAEVFEAYGKSAHFVAKLHLMGGNDLVRAASSLSKQLSKLILSLRAERVGLMREKTRLANVLEAVRHHRKNAADALEAFRIRGLQGGVPPAEAGRLENIFKAESAQAENLAREHDRALLELRTKAAALYARALRSLKDVWPSLLPFIAGTRSELGESFDAETYRELIEDTSALDFLRSGDMEVLFGIDAASVAELSGGSIAVPQQAPAQLSDRAKGTPDSQSATVPAAYSGSAERAPGT